MTTAFFAGIVASDYWKAGPTFTSSADLLPLMPRICRPLTRPRAALVAITEAYGDFLGRYYSLESARKLFMLFANLPGQTVAELAEKLFRIFHLIFPIFRAHSQQFAHRFVRNLHPVQRQPVLRRNVTDRRLLRRPASFHALQYPFQHSDIFAVTGPQEFAIRTLAAAVHVHNLRPVCRVAPGWGPRAAVAGNRSRRRLAGNAFPPRVPFRSHGHVRKQRILVQGPHHVLIGLHSRAGGHAKESRFRIDAAQISVLAD